MSKDKQKLLIAFFSSTIGVYVFLILKEIFTSVLHFQDYCSEVVEKSKNFPDFFYYIAFAKTTFISSNPYSESNLLLSKYLCTEPTKITLGFSYPPNVLLFISHFDFLEKTFGFKNLPMIVLAGNILFCVLIALVLRKITGFSWLWILLIALTSNISLMALISGQLSISFALVLTIAAYFYLNKKYFLAGLLLSLFLVKPQIGVVLLPLCLSRKRLFAGCALGGILGMLYPLLLRGKTIFIDYYRQFFLEQDKELFFLAKQSIALPSILFKNSIVSNHTLLILIQGIFLLLGFFVVLMIYKKDKNLSNESKFGFLILMNTLISPYLLIYDYFLCIVAIALLAKQFIKDKIFVLLSFSVLYLALGFAFGATTDIWVFLFILVSYLVLFKSSLVFQSRPLAKIAKNKKPKKLRRSKQNSKFIQN